MNSLTLHTQVLLISKDTVLKVVYKHVAFLYYILIIIILNLWQFWLK